MLKTREEWLNEPLYQFSRGNVLTVGEAVEGIAIIGGTGSGKTTGSGRAVAVEMLRLGFGGLVLSAKPEVKTWEGYYQQAAKDPDFDPDYDGPPEEYDPQKAGKLVVVKSGGEYKFDPIAYDFGIATGDASATAASRLVNLFVSVLGSGDGRGSTADPYWMDSLRELITHAVDLDLFSRATVSKSGEVALPTVAPSVQRIQDIIRTAAQSPSEAASDRWQQSESVCATLIREAYAPYHDANAKRPDDEVLADFRDTFNFWLRGFPGLAERTRSVIVSSFTSKASGILRAPLRGLLCGGGEEGCHPDATPEATFRGKVVLLDLPVKSYGEVGAFAQKLIKTVWQHATESPLRDVDGPCRPVFLWADEAQYFLTPDDVMYQSTARSKLAATVHLTQNLPNYHTQLGGPGSSQTDALLGSLQTKVLHANGDPTTNEWAERLFGTEESEEPQSTENQPHIGAASGSTSKTMVYRRMPFVPAYQFTELLKGGSPHGRSEAYVFMPGKRWEACYRKDEAVDGRYVTSRIRGRGIRHLFLQEGDRDHCDPEKEDCCEVCVPSP